MKKTLKILAVNALILAVFLLFFEFGLRLFWKMSSLKKELYRTSSNRILRYELKPNTKIKYEGYDVAINSDGFRGREYSIEKPANTYRIVVLGDSVGFGRMIPPEDNLPCRLEAALKRFCPEKNFEVLNMGIEGYNSIQELEMLKAKGLKYRPDLVIVYYNLNDADYPEYYFKKNFINQHFLLARYIQYKIKKYRIKRDRILKGVKSDEDNYRYLYSTDCWQQAKEALLEMADLTASGGIRMVLLIYPELSGPVKNFRGGYPFWYINDMLENIAHKNIIVIDPTKEYNRLDLKKEEIAVWAYANAKANDIIGEYTIKELQSRGIKLCGR